MCDQLVKLMSMKMKKSTFFISASKYAKHDLSKATPRESLQSVLCHTSTKVHQDVTSVWIEFCHSYKVTPDNKTHVSVLNGWD